MNRTKQEIIDEAKKIGVYDMSISDYTDCCLAFQPKHPIIKPRKKVAEALEEKLIWKLIIENTKIEKYKEL